MESSNKAIKRLKSEKRKRDKNPPKWGKIFQEN